VLREGCCVADELKVLMKSSFVKMNLEFHCPMVNSLPADIWESIGHRVHKISFYHECAVGYKTLENVILNCVNLTSLKLFKDWHPVLSSKMLDILIDKGVKRRRLSTFAMFYKSEQRILPSPDILEKIFVIFPCVKRLGVQNTFDWHRRHVFRGTPLVLKLPTQLEILEYNIRLPIDYLKRTMIPLWESRFDCFDHCFVVFDFSRVDVALILSFCRFKLTRLETTLAASEDAEKIFQFFAIQNELKSVTLYLSSNNEYAFAKKLMFHILERCSKLSEFRFESDCKWIVGTSQEYNRFLVLISKLQTLSVDFTFQVESALTSSPINLALNVLSLPGEDAWNVLQYCSVLQHLEIVDAEDVSLQGIFKNMVVLYE
jgi:hypothetical protein